MKPITIFGGGLAGLTLGIALRDRGIPATVYEAGRYPRHRVCGEFISGAGLDVLRALKLVEVVGPQARSARDCAFFTPSKLFSHRSLPEPALTISRFHLDAALARQFCGLGGTLCEGQRWPGPVGEGVVCAAGRRIHPAENGCRWFGLRIHVRNVQLEADLEMHLARDCYVGLCRLSEGEVNVCGFFRRRARSQKNLGTGEVKESNERPEVARGVGDAISLLRGEPGSCLFTRLQDAQVEPGSFCAVAGLSVRPEPIDLHQCCIGDALTMIPPFTGNGMSMAFESAQLALEPLVQYSLSRSAWGETVSEIVKALVQAFSWRLRWAGLLHRLMFSPFNAPALQLLLSSERGWRTAYAATR